MSWPMLKAVRHIMMGVPGVRRGWMLVSHPLWSSPSSPKILSLCSFGTIVLCGLPRYPSVMTASMF